MEKQVAPSPLQRLPAGSLAAHALPRSVISLLLPGAVVVPPASRPRRHSFDSLFSNSWDYGAHDAAFTVGGVRVSEVYASARARKRGASHHGAPDTPKSKKASTGLPKGYIECTGSPRGTRKPAQLVSRRSFSFTRDGDGRVVEQQLSRSEIGSSHGGAPSDDARSRGSPPSRSSSRGSKKIESILGLTDSVSISIAISNSPRSARKLSSVLGPEEALSWSPTRTHKSQSSPKPDMSNRWSRQFSMSTGDGTKQRKRSSLTEDRVLSLSGVASDLVSSSAPPSLNRDELTTESSSELGESDSPRGSSVVFEASAAGNTLVVAASLNDLLHLLYGRRATDLDPELIDVFLHSHTLVISSADLFHRLTCDYKTFLAQPSPSSRIRRMRILNVLKKWLQQGGWRNLEKPFQQFFHYLHEEASPENISWAQILRQTYLRGVAEDGHFEMLDKATECPGPTVPKVKDPSRLNLSNIDPTELARQLTLADVELFRRIEPNELINLNWQSGLGPNIDALTRRTQTLSDWIRSEVVGTPHFKERVLNLSRAIVLCDELIEMRNYCSAVAVAIALHLLRPLTKEWKKITGKAKLRWPALTKLFSVSGDFFGVRELMASAEDPFVAPLMLLQKDLVMIYEQKHEHDRKGLINIVKMRHLHSVWRLVQRTQRSVFRFARVPKIQTFIAQHLVPLDADVVLNLQRQIEMDSSMPEGAPKWSI